MPVKPISRKSVIIGEVDEFLQAERMQCEVTRQGVVELINQISTYKEEGKALFPEVYITDDIDKIKSFLTNNEFIKFGSGPRIAQTMLKALKKCAPLSIGGWAIYILRRATEFEYGLFRSGSTIISVQTSKNVIAEGNKENPIILVHQLSEKIVEVKGVLGHSLIVNFGIKSTSDLSPVGEQTQLIEKIIEKTPEGVKDQLRIFFSRVFLYVMQNGHGNLCVVVDGAVNPIPEQIIDGIYLDTPISITSKIEQLNAEIKQGLGHDILEKNAQLNSYFNVIVGMMMSDGITVFSNEGSVLGYNVFVKYPDNLNEVEGGGRSRTFEALKSWLSNSMVSVYIQSQDGKTQTKNYE